MSMLLAIDFDGGLVGRPSSQRSHQPSDIAQGVVPDSSGGAGDQSSIDHIRQCARRLVDDGDDDLGADFVDPVDRLGEIRLGDDEIDDSPVIRSIRPHDDLGRRDRDPDVDEFLGSGGQEGVGVIGPRERSMRGSRS